MSKVDEYARAISELEDPEPYLLEHSGLPGPRGNIELALAAGRTLPSETLRRWAATGADEAPTGGAEEFLSFCGVVGLGRLLAEGDGTALEDLRHHAGDERWRIREAVAMALQHWGEDDFKSLADAMADWADGSWLERRAAAAALAEPALLTTDDRVRATLAVLGTATRGVARAEPEERRSDEFKAMRKGLGYCWSVAVAAAPAIGRPAFEALADDAEEDRDLLWIVRENLKKKRLERADADWVTAMRDRLANLSG